MSNTKLAVVICTHNPREDYLSRVIDGLRCQTLDKSVWEFLLVDNCSDTPVACSFADWHPNGRTVREDEIGLTRARMCGIKNSATPLIVFVDDDNVLRPDYLQETLRLSEQHPLMGVFGAARILPEFEEEPTPECRPFVGMLALRSLNRTMWSNDPRDMIIPWGAGLVVRRDVATEFVRDVAADLRRLSLDRKGDSLDSCGDNVFSWNACKLGYGKALFVELGLTHLIDSSRVTSEYLQKIAEGHSYSDAMLRFIQQPELENYADRFSSFSSPSVWLVAMRALRQLLGPFGHLLHFSMRHRIEDSQQRGLKRARRSIRGGPS